jgi:shikimate dehydrogenase
MFDSLDSSTVSTGGVSCISKQGSLLVGHAKDPLTVGMSLDAILGERHFARTGGHVLVLGAGGAGLAIAVHLIGKERAGDRPARVIMLNRSEDRLDRVRQLLGELRTDIVFEYVCNEDARHSDEMMMKLPAGSVVVNATGMGKDVPGSPVTDRGLFPRNGIAWELNYRGDLRFWRQAMAQSAERNLTVEDGWRYFLYGWSEHIKEVLHVSITPEMFGRLGSIAERLRIPPLSKPGGSAAARDVRS